MELSSKSLAQGDAHNPGTFRLIYRPYFQFLHSHHKHLITSTLYEVTEILFLLEESRRL